ncbi:MAG: tetratricopeptide repeat protein [Archangiaceae bacterium]|nr:tetratricopeptide repeat protein [Archangiaceae bacterium]
MNLALILMVSVAAASDAKRGREAVKAGRYSEGCTLLERARVQDPSLQALLQVADCFERAGRPVKAYALYDEAWAWTEERQDGVRGELVKARLAALEEKLSFLSLSSVGHETGLSVRAGEVELPLGRDRLVPVQEGLVELTVSAPGFVPWHASVEVGARRKLPVLVPPLTPSVVDVPPPPPPMAPPLVVERQVSPSRKLPIALMTGSTMVFIAGLTGLWWSFTTFNALQQQQVGGGKYGSPTVSRGDLATMRTVYPASWVLAGVGVVGIVTNLIWLALPRPTSTQLSVTPGIGGAAVSGTW